MHEGPEGDGGTQGGGDPDPSTDQAIQRATQRDVEPRPSPKHRKSFRDSFADLEPRLKVAAVVISAFALIAPIASATAAWFSWRTAKATEDIARATLDTAGANLSILPSVTMHGSCDNPKRPLTIQVTVENAGRIGSDVKSLSLLLDTDQGVLPEDKARGMKITQTLNEHIDAIQVPQQNNVIVPMPINCDQLRNIGFEGPQLEFDLVHKVNSRPPSMKVMAGVPLHGTQITTVTDISYYP